MDDTPDERTAMLVIRLWQRRPGERAPVGRISHTTDVIDIPQTTDTVHGADEIRKVVGDWLEAVVAPLSGAADETE
jgi:hypothetical protein